MYKFSMVLISTAVLFLSGCVDEQKSVPQENQNTITQNTIPTHAIEKVNTPPIAKTQTFKTLKVEVIHGHTLPPEPDETLNNSTLLGIDSNNNGVRDDVERKIIKKYQTPIKIELMLSKAKVHQKILENPIGNAIELQKENNKLSHCLFYLKRKKVFTSLEVRNTVSFIENNIYNTKARVKAYSDYNQALSGGVYGITRSKINAQACDFDVETLLKEQK
jgi:hypothetical protein